VSTPLKRAISLARRHGTVRSCELGAAGVARAQLSRMVAAGELTRVARGLYGLPGRSPDENEALAVVSRRAPQTLFCLLTALRLHELTTQSPFEVWIAVGNKDRAPRLHWPPLRVVRFSAAALKSGVEERAISEGTIRLTSVAKTVADCFKFRHMVGLDVALEALREALRERRTNVDELWKQATICRVTRVMRPYLEAMA
jgi:predicted transcriptional regulator of viral defense system